MPSTIKSRSSSSRRGGSKRGSDNSMIALFGLAAAGGAYFLLRPKTAGAAELPPGSSSTNAKPSGSTAAAGKPTSELSEELKKQMAEALGRLGVSPASGQLSGAADADAIRFATQLVGTLDAMGYKEAAKALREYADQAARHVQTPASAAPIAAAAPAGLTPEQRDYVARVMSLEREPDKLGLLIDWLKKLSPSAERDTMIQMAQALRLQLAAAQSTAATMNQIDQVIKAPNVTAVQQAASAPPVPVIVPTPAPKQNGSYDPGIAPTVITSPGIANVPGQGKPSLPETPVAVPSRPVPQPVPVPATPIELAAKAMVDNLLATLSKYGSLASAKGHEDQTLVKKFQALAQTTADGKAGPATLILAAGKGAVNLPPVFYWPTTSTATTVQQYKSGLEKLAQKFLEMGRATDAATLRASIAREPGLGGVAKPAPVAAPQPTPSPVKPPSQATDPFPAWPLLKLTSPYTKGTMVSHWQQVLVKGGFLPNQPSSTDGVFGPGTKAATQALQKKAGMIASAQDGVVGPNTRTAANYLGLW